jgi:hypothetical protein
MSRQYESGLRDAYAAMLSECCRNLGYNDLDAQKTAWIKERERVISALRRVCAEYGDQDWDEKCSLDDVIEKHLHRNLAGSTE